MGIPRVKAHHGWTRNTSAICESRFHVSSVCLDFWISIATSRSAGVRESIMSKPSLMQRRRLRPTDPRDDLHGASPCQGPPRIDEPWDTDPIHRRSQLSWTLGWDKADQGAMIRHPGTQSRSISSLDWNPGSGILSNLPISTPQSPSFAKGETRGIATHHLRGPAIRSSIVIAPYSGLAASKSRSFPDSGSTPSV